MATRAKTKGYRQTLSMYIITHTHQILELPNIYEKYLGYKTDGTFVEVGAFDGETHSNTAFLADLGWRGYYVEPVRQHADICRERHKNNKVTVIELAAGARKGLAEISLSGELSTTIKNPNEFYNKVGLPQFMNQHLQKPVIVLQDTLEAILTTYKVPKDFDILTIDTEGTEWDILEHFDISKWRPKVVIIEMHEQSSHWTNIPLIAEMNVKLNEYFEKANYKKIYSDTINTVFVL